MARQVLHSSISVYSTEDLLLLADLGREGEAIGSIRLISDPIEKCRSLLGVYDVLRDKDRSNRGLLDEALEIARNIINLEAKAAALGELSIRCYKDSWEERAQSIFEETLETAKSIPNYLEGNRPRSLAALGVRLTKAGLNAQAKKAFSEARQAALNVEGVEYYMDYITLEASIISIAEVAILLAKAERPEDAKRDLQTAEAMFYGYEGYQEHLSSKCLLRLGLASEVIGDKVKAKLDFIHLMSEQRQ